MMELMRTSLANFLNAVNKQIALSSFVASLMTEKETDRSSRAMEEAIVEYNQKMAKNKPAKPNQSNSFYSNSSESRQNTSRLYLKLFLLISAILLIYFIFFYQKEDLFVINLPLPYVYFNPFLRALQTFSQLDCHNEVLLVLGSKGIGKSRGITTFLDTNINSEGHSNRLVIQFDCDRLTQLTTDDDIIEFFQYSVFDGIRNLDASISQSSFLYSSFHGYKKSIAEQVSAISNVFKSHQSNRLRKRLPIHDEYLRSIGNSLEMIISHMKNQPSFSLNLFLQCIDIISPTFRPIIIINSPEKFYSLTNRSHFSQLDSFLNLDYQNSLIDLPDSLLAKELFDTFVLSLRQISHDTSHTGIIIEISDMLWLHKIADKYRSDIALQNVLRRIYVDEFDLNDAKSQLTIRGMFKPAQVQKLYDLFGGYGPHFAQVHELMQQGISYQDAVVETQQMIYKDFMKTIINQNITENNETLNTNVDTDKIEFLNRMVKDRYYSLSQINDLSPNVRYFIETLIKNGILSIQSNNQLRFTNFAEFTSAQYFLHQKN